jgi:hypothetical protein
MAVTDGQVATLRAQLANPLPAADVDMWEQKIIAAITEVGLAVEEVKR